MPGPQHDSRAYRIFLTLLITVLEYVNFILWRDCADEREGGMKRLATNKIWLMAGLALGILALAQVGSLAESGSAGRDFSRCVQSCNETRKACQESCKTDCRDLYPQGTEERNTCESECSETCISNSQECKEVCQNIKNPPSPEEP